MADNTSAKQNRLMAFSGPAGRTYFDRDGNLQTAAENEIREEYDPLTGAYLGMLIESQSRTNLQPYSSDFSKWTNTTSNAKDPVIQSSDNASFLAGATADKIRFELNAEGYSYSLKDTQTGISGSFVFSIFAKLVDGNTDTLEMYRDSPNPLENGVSTKLSKERWTRISFSGNDNTSSLKVGLITRRGSKNNDWIEVLLDGAQIETGTVASSYIPTNGSPVTLPGEDARFTDPTVFNNFERGALVASAKSTSGSVLSTPGQELMPAFTGKRAISWNGDTPAVVYENGQKVASSLVVKSTQEALRLLFDGNGYLPDVDVHPKPLSNSEAQQLTQNNARTVIGDCPSGGYYDYSDLSTLFVESDASDIPIERRTPARVGDRIGAILDVSGHENHMTASTDDRRGVLESDGVRYWIRFNDSVSYGFDFGGDYSLTLITGIDYEKDEKFSILSNSDGNPNDNKFEHALNFTSSSDDGGGKLDFFAGLSSIKTYYNGKAKAVSNRFDSYQAISTNPVLLKGLYKKTGNSPSIVYLNGFRFGWSLNGKSYGFAWASRLSEDDALIVEKDMRRNMPELPS